MPTVMMTAFDKILGVKNELTGGMGKVFVRVLDLGSRESVQL